MRKYKTYLFCPNPEQGEQMCSGYDQTAVELVFPERGEHFIEGYQPPTDLQWEPEWIADLARDE